jgi:hypothetical protein
MIWILGKRFSISLSFSILLAEIIKESGFNFAHDIAS